MTTVGILFGGQSVEHDISLISAKNIVQYLDKDKFTAKLIGIDKAGKWFLNNSLEDKIETGAPLALTLNASEPAFLNLDTNEKFSLDVIFPVLHGTDGEDGSIQGALKACGIPFVGSGVLGSAVSMNKLATKKLLSQADIPTSKYLYFDKKHKDKIDYDTLQKELGIPFIAKPANLGSSVGVSKVKNTDTLKAAVDEIFSYDQTILFEGFVAGRELECAVMGNTSPIASVPGEITISDAYEFYTFEAKYVDKEAAKIIIPADLPDVSANKIKSLCIEAYEALFCEDFARVDLFLTPDGNVYINEINTIPGFTNSSMFPKLWEHDGIQYTELLTKLIRMSLERASQSTDVNKVFESGLN